MSSRNVHIVKTNRKEKFWFHNIRSTNYFCYRYWWLVLFIFIIYIVLWYLFCFKTPYLTNCPNNQSISNNINRINEDLDNCCGCTPNIKVTPDTIVKNQPDTVAKPPLYVPRENCRVHFSGAIMGGEPDNGISKIYEVDQWSEYVGEGDYPDNIRAFPKSVASTFDGIAIDAGTHLIIYSEKNFSGVVLLDVYGPKIINNGFYKNDPRYSHCNTDLYSPALQKTYPPSVRIWSNGDMHDWSFGSCKIICSN